MSRPLVPTTDRLEAQLRRLSQAQLTSFCAAVWAARGYETRVDESRCVARRDDEQLHISVVAPGRLPRLRSELRQWVPATQSDAVSSADLVVSVHDGPWVERMAARRGARVVGPDELAEMLLYGLPRTSAASLTAQHLDTSLSTLLTAEPPARSDTNGVVRLVPVATVAGVLCLVVAAALAGVWAPVESASPTAASSSAVTPTPRPDSAAEQVTRPPSNGTDLGRTESDEFTGDYPPGVNEGFLDPWVLADAHARLADGRSYRLIVRHGGTESLDGTRQWAGAWQHAVVEDDRTWLYSVVGYAATENGSELVTYSLFADGEFAYRRTNGPSGPTYTRFPVRFTAPDEYGPHTDRTRRYLIRYLTTTEVSVDRPSWNPEAFRVVATGQPAYLEPNVTNYTATAMVSDAGFVSELTVEYTVPDDPERTDRTFRFEYAAADETTLRPPSWYDDAQVATRGNVTAG